MFSPLVLSYLSWTFAHTSLHPGRLLSLYPCWNFLLLQGDQHWLHFLQEALRAVEGLVLSHPSTDFNPPSVICPSPALGPVSTPQCPAEHLHWRVLSAPLESNWIWTGLASSSTSGIQQCDVCECVLSHVRLFVILWTVAHLTSVHGILQASILDWVAISYSRGSSWPRIEPASPSLQVDSFLRSNLGSPGSTRE